jgi:hypothetical protein
MNETIINENINEYIASYSNDNVQHYNMSFIYDDIKYEIEVNLNEIINDSYEYKHKCCLDDGDLFDTEYIYNITKELWVVPIIIKFYFTYITGSIVQLNKTSYYLSYNVKNYFQYDTIKYVDKKIININDGDKYFVYDSIWSSKKFFCSCTHIDLSKIILETIDELGQTLSENKINMYLALKNKYDNFEYEENQGHGYDEYIILSKKYVISRSGDGLYITDDIYHVYNYMFNLL